MSGKVDFNTHPYDKNKGIYNFLFHPFHLKNKVEKTLSVVTHLFVTLVSGGLWQIPFWIVHRIDQKKIEKWKKEKATKANQVAFGSPVFSSTSAPKGVSTPPPSQPINVGSQSSTDETPSSKILSENQTTPASPSDVPLLKTFIQKKLTEEASPAAASLVNCLKLFRKEPPFEFETITTLEGVLAALEIANGFFSPNSEEFAIPVRLKVLAALDSFIKELYENHEPPPSFKEEIKTAYLNAVSSLNIFSAEEENLISNIKRDKERISVAEIVIPLVTKFPLAEGVEITLTEGGKGHLYCRWILSSMGFKVKPYPMTLMTAFFVEMERASSEKLFPQVLESKTTTHDVLRIVENYLNKLIAKDPSGVEKRFKECFPGENFNAYDANRMASSGQFSPDPHLFEIPLLAEARNVRVNCYVMDRTGSFKLHSCGPETASSSFNIGLFIGPKFQRAYQLL